MANLTINGYDITSQNYAQRPTTAGLVPAFYSTGSANIKMTAEMESAFPHAIRYTQGNGTDLTADLVDVEPGCYTPAQMAAMMPQMIANFHSGARPGQRFPGFYATKGITGYTITDCVNALNAAGLGNSGIGIVLADWNLSEAEAAAMVATSIPGPGNPFPIIGVQYSNAGPYDLDVWSASWLSNVSEGTKMVAVPNVVGQTAGNAHNTILAAGFTPRDANWTEGDSDRQVTAQTPTAGTEAPAGSVVDYTVAPVAPPSPPKVAGVVITSALNVTQVTSTDGGKTWISV